MSTRLINLGKTIVLVLILLGCVIRASDQEQRLPPIWGSSMESDFMVPPDEQDDSSGYYWIEAELQLVDMDKTYLLHEGSAKSEKKFRLDIINQTTGRTETILNKREKERYYYRPFNCYPFEQPKSTIFADWIDAFPESTNCDPLLLTGIGSIWEYVLSTKYRFVAAGKGGVDVDVSYNKFIADATERFPYEVKFYFENLNNQMSFAGIHLNRKVKSSNNKIIIRKIEYKTSNEAEDRLNVDPNFFDLPLGYGCVRRDTAGHEYKPPKALLDLEEGKPTILEMEIVSDIPICLDHDIGEWQTHSSHLRIIGGNLILGENYSREYYMFQVQKRGDSSPSLQSHRRVWDLGVPNSDPDNKERQLQKARHYDINEITGSCSGYGESQFNEIANVEFPISLLINSQKCDQKLAGLVLDQKELRKLFISRDGYSFVRYSRDDSFAWKETYYYERRDERFELRNSAGSQVLIGPVSLVRAYSTFQKGISESLRGPMCPRDFEIRVMINLLSEGADRMIARITLNMLNGRLIDQAEYHRELGHAGTCFEDPTGVSTKANTVMTLFTLKVSKSDSTSSIDFSVTYNIENIVPEVGWTLAKNGTIRELIYEKFIKSIMTISDHRIDPLQLHKIEIEFVATERDSIESVRVSGSLAEVSTLLAYSRLKGQKFSLSTRRQALTGIKSDENKCAESCHHYQCSKFVYCKKSNQCNWLMQDDEETDFKTSTHMITFEPDENCDLFERRARKSMMSTRQFFHVFNEKILSRSDDKSRDRITRELDIEIVFGGNNNEDKNGSCSFRLRPNLLKIRSPHSSSNVETDYESSSGLTSNKLQPASPFVDQPIEKTDMNELKLEYSVLFTHRKFKERLAKSDANFPIRVVNHVDAERCETICEDNNCNSFSYCQVEKTCLISLLHRQGAIEPMTESAEFCAIMTLDYLSKFDKSHEVVKPPKLVTKSLPAHSQHDCAILCVEETDFKCRAFYYCHKSDSESSQNCFLQKDMSRIRKDIAAASTDSVPIELDATASVSKCHSFLRSYLTEFDKFYAKRIATTIESNANNIITKTSLGAEHCSFECAERLGKCLAFHVCYTGFDPVCVLLMLDEQPESLDKSQWHWIVLDPKELEDSSGCTSFIVARGSQLHSALEANILMRGDVIVNPDKSEDKFEDTLPPAEPAGESWFIGLLLTSLGVVIGYSVGFIYKKLYNWRSNR